MTTPDKPTTDPRTSREWAGVIEVKIAMSKLPGADKKKTDFEIYEEAIRRAQDQARGNVDEYLNFIKCLKSALEQKSKEIGKAEHRGNTVDYIYDKFENYSRQLDEMSEKIDHLRSILQEVIKAYPCNNQGDCHCLLCVARHALSATEGNPRIS